jgi:hypothetical protein
MPETGIKVHFKLVPSDKGVEGEKMLHVLDQIRITAETSCAHRVKPGSEKDEFPIAVSPPDDDRCFRLIIDSHNLVIPHGLELVHHLAALPS